MSEVPGTIKIVPRVEHGSILDWAAHVQFPNLSGTFGPRAKTPTEALENFLEVYFSFRFEEDVRRHGNA